MANLKDLIVNGSARILGTLYAPDIKNTQRVTEFIVGTQTASTGSWTGVTQDTILYDGKNINYFLPYAGSGNATLNLTLAGGTTTGAKPIYLSGTSYVTTHYGANSCINMTYNSTKGAWFVNADRDNNDVTRLQWSNAIKAETAITAYRVIVGTSSGYKNITANTTFDITYPILYSKSAINATATGTNNWQSEPAVNLANNKSGWTGTNYSVVYLVGTLSGTTFTIDSTMLTTTVPTTEDGKVYTPLGVMYSTTNCYFRPTNQYYIYKNGSFQPYGSSGSGSSSRNIGEIVSSTVPLTDAGLHLLDGSILSSDGVYANFVTYIASLQSTYPDLFYDEETWQWCVNNHGVCGKFVYTVASGSNPATLRLPKITGFIEGTIDTTNVGGFTLAGLPNITGSPGSTRYFSISESDRTSNVTGCYSSSSTGMNSNYESGGEDNFTCSLYFNASDSNAIYGRSSTVQPQSIKVLYYIVVANTTKTEIEVDIDNVITDLNTRTAPTNFDGQWVRSTLQIADGATIPTSSDKSYSISSYLPNDGYTYEVLFGATGTTTSTSGSYLNVMLHTDIITSGYSYVCGARTRTSSTHLGSGSIILPVGTGRTVSVHASSGYTGTYSLYAVGYRRIGTNS